MSIRQKVAEKISGAHGIAWDGCHKIYILMDAAQMERMMGFGYGSEGSELWAVSSSNRQYAVDMVMDWYADSCALRFIQSIHTNVEDPNAGYESVASQFSDDEVPPACDICGITDEEVADWCGSCGCCQEHCQGFVACPN